MLVIMKVLALELPGGKSSAVQANGHEQVLKCPQSLLCLFNGTVGLDCAGHMEADVIDKWNGVCLLPGGYSCCLFPHCLHKVLSLDQLQNSGLRTGCTPA